MIEANVSDYDLIQCLNFENCKETNGYVKNDSGIYAFVENVREKVTTGGKYGLSDGSTKKDCVIEGDSPNVGKMIYDDQEMCIGNKESIKFENGEYIILKNNPAVKNTPFADNTISVPIKSRKNYIIRDQFYNKGK